MMPDRTGGAPSFVYPAFRMRWPRAAKHANGLASWMYRLGWFPVAPLNMILAWIRVRAALPPLARAGLYSALRAIADAQRHVEAHAPLRR